MRIQLLPVALLAVVAGTPALAEHDEHGRAAARGGPPLITLMHYMQYYSHKLGLAIGAGNQPLAGFYAHEVEEVIESVERVRDFEGIPVRDLIGQTLKPAFQDLEAAVANDDLAAMDARYDALLGSCNACHRAAGRPFIVIKRNDANPYPQDFSVAPTNAIR